MSSAATPTAFRTLSDVVLALAAEREVEPVLQRLVHAARELGGARYAALGVPDGEGGFARFITSGMSDELIAAMGPLPRTHGLLGAMLESPAPYRTPDIHTHERFRGWWPPRTPDMRSFLGVPIVARGGDHRRALPDRQGGRDAFSEADERLIVLLAAHAAIAIENARLHERSRELSIVEERNRLARELHDSVTQQLFGVVLAAQSAGELLARGDAAGEAARARAGAGARGDGRAALGRVRAAAGVARGRGARAGAAQARRGAAARDGPRDRAAGRGAAGARRGSRPARCSGSRRRRCRTRCATPGAARIEVRLEDGGGRLAAERRRRRARLRPGGAGLRGRRLGLTSMEERATELGGRLAIESRPGEGTTVRLEVPA